MPQEMAKEQQAPVKLQARKQPPPPPPRRRNSKKSNNLFKNVNLEAQPYNSPDVILPEDLVVEPIAEAYDSDNSLSENETKYVDSKYFSSPSESKCLYAPNQGMARDAMYVRQLEADYHAMQQNFLQLMSQNARMQFRVRQLLCATPHERCQLLRELETVTFDYSREPERDMLQASTEKRAMGSVRCKQQLLIRKLRCQLSSLEDAEAMEGLAATHAKRGARKITSPQQQDKIGDHRDAKVKSELKDTVHHSKMNAPPADSGRQVAGQHNSFTRSSIRDSGSELNSRRSSLGSGSHHNDSPAASSRHSSRQRIRHRRSSPRYSNREHSSSLRDSSSHSSNQGSSLRLNSPASVTSRHSNMDNCSRPSSFRRRLRKLHSNPDSHTPRSSSQRSSVPDCTASNSLSRSSLQRSQSRLSNP